MYIHVVCGVCCHGKICASLLSILSTAVGVHV